jgi:hypothetical protein
MSDGISQKAAIKGFTIVGIETLALAIEHTFARELKAWVAFAKINFSDYAATRQQWIGAANDMAARAAANPMEWGRNVQETLERGMLRQVSQIEAGWAQSGFPKGLSQLAKADAARAMVRLAQSNGVQVGLGFAVSLPLVIHDLVHEDYGAAARTIASAAAAEAAALATSGLLSGPAIAQLLGVGGSIALRALQQPRSPASTCRWHASEPAMFAHFQLSNARCPPRLPCSSSRTWSICLRGRC